MTRRPAWLDDPEVAREERALVWEWLTLGWEEDDARRDNNAVGGTDFEEGSPA